MRKMLLVAAFACVPLILPVNPAQAAIAGGSPRHVCRGFPYRGVRVHDLIARDVSCEKATPLAKRYYDVASPKKHDGFRVSGPWRGYPGPIGGPILRKGVRGLIQIHGPAYRPQPKPKPPSKPPTPKPQPTPPPPGIPDMQEAAAIVDRYDANHNGEVTTSESWSARNLVFWVGNGHPMVFFVNASIMFAVIRARFDTSPQDSYLSPSELDALNKALVAMDTPPPPGVVSIIDAAKTILDEFDTNHDGRLVTPEATDADDPAVVWAWHYIAQDFSVPMTLGEIYEFAHRYDLNHDDWVIPDESARMWSDIANYRDAEVVFTFALALTAKYDTNRNAAVEPADGPHAACIANTIAARVGSTSPVISIPMMNSYLETYDIDFKGDQVLEPVEMDALINDLNLACG